MTNLTARKFANVFNTFSRLSLLGVILSLVSCMPAPVTSSSTTAPPVSRSYERIELWDFREGDTVRFTILDTYPEAASRRQGYGLPFVWKDADIAQSAPIAGKIVNQQVKDSAYGGKTYRVHSYIVESDQRAFGYSASFTVLPHLHVLSTESRLISIGVDRSNDADAQTRSVIAVILPDGARDIAITDMQPYKTLAHNARTIYYYDIRPVTSHQSIHISYTLTGIPTTDIDTTTVINNSRP